MTQLELTARPAWPPETEHQQQEAELERVSDHLAEFIATWCRRRLAAGRAHFHGAELGEDVKKALGSAPESAARVLRVLRGKGRVAYRVVNRAQSLYELLGVP